MHPAAALVCQPADVANRVERPGVHVACLRADDERHAVITVRQLPFKLGDAHAALVVDGHDLGCSRAEAEVAQRDVDGRMPLGTDDDPHPRCADEPLRLDVPTQPLQGCVTRRREGREVRHRRARDKSRARGRGQAQQIEQPGTRDIFDDGSGRTGDVEARVLVPHARQPVGGKGSRDAAADHEPEVPRTAGSDETGFAGRSKFSDYRPRFGRLLGQVAAEALGEDGGIDVRADGPIGNGVQIVSREIGRESQELVEVVHGDPPAVGYPPRMPNQESTDQAWLACITITMNAIRIIIRF